jgi:hypothetical protein
MRTAIRRSKRLAAVAALGCGFLFGGCDPTLRATAESGIIAASNALFSSFLTAAVQLILENNSDAGNNGTP